MKEIDYNVHDINYIMFIINSSKCYNKLSSIISVFNIKYFPLPLLMFYEIQYDIISHYQRHPYKFSHTIITAFVKGNNTKKN